MGPCNVIFYILLLYSHFLSVNICDVTHTKQPTAGYRCVASPSTELTLWKTDHPQCMLKCLQLKTCHYIFHNYGISRCDLGSDKCEFFAPVDDVTVSVFGPPRDTCVRWGSRQEHWRVPVELHYLGYLIFLARITRDDTLLLGKFHREWGGQHFGPTTKVRDSDQCKKQIKTLNFSPRTPPVPCCGCPIRLVGYFQLGLSVEGSSRMGPPRMPVK